MAKGVYLGDGNVARKVKKAYVGIGNEARKVKKAYIGVDGTARLVWSGMDGAFINIKYTNTTTGSLSAYTPDHSLIGTYSLTANEVVYLSKSNSDIDTNCFVLGFIGTDFYLFTFACNSGQYVAKIAQFRLNDNSISLIRVLNFQPHAGQTKDGAYRVGAVIINNHIIIGTCAHYEEISTSYRCSTGCYKYDANLTLVKERSVAALNGGFCWAGSSLSNNEFVAYRILVGGYSVKVAVNFDTMVARDLAAQSYQRPKTTVPALPSGTNIYTECYLSGVTQNFGTISMTSNYHSSISYARNLSTCQLDGYVTIGSIAYYQQWIRLYKQNEDGTPLVLIGGITGSSIYSEDIGRSSPVPQGIAVPVWGGATYNVYNQAGSLIMEVTIPGSGNPTHCSYFKLT